jgi:hypothetical protein
MMVGLTETSVWEDEIYQIEQTDAVVAGEPNLGAGQGIPNVPNQQLANRTQWLKEQLTATAALLSGYVPTTRLISTGAGLTGGGALSANRTLAVSFATQAEAEAGTEAQKAMSPLGVKQAIAAALADLLDGAPTALDTLNELAAALGDDPNFAATITDMINQLSNDLGSASQANLTDNEDLAVDPENIPTRGNVAAYVEGLALGVGQTWQDMYSSRAANTSYENTTGRPIMVYIAAEKDGGVDIQVSSDGVSWVKVGVAPENDTGPQQGSSFVVPAGSYYRINGSVESLLTWSELR